MKNPRPVPIIIVLISLGFAGVILIASQLLRGTGYAATVTNLLVALWFIPFTYLRGEHIKIQITE